MKSFRLIEGCHDGIRQEQDQQQKAGQSIRYKQFCDSKKHKPSDRDANSGRNYMGDCILKEKIDRCKKKQRYVEVVLQQMMSTPNTTPCRINPRTLVQKAMRHM